MSQYDRPFYDVIRADLPCKLYFDIVYCRVINPSRDGERAMAIFKDVLSTYLEMFLGFEISVTLTPGNYAVTLMKFDSSDDTYFSRHVVVIFPNNLVFRNTDDVGIFVKSI